MTRIALFTLLLLLGTAALHAQTARQWRDSLTALNRLIDNQPQSTDLRLKKAAVNIELEQWEYAIEEYGRVLGIDAEKKMLEATGGVNTHRGALFSMGLAVVAASHALALGNEDKFVRTWAQTVATIASEMPGGSDTHGACIKQEHKVAGALELAQDGYKELTSLWLPFFIDNKSDENVKHKTLLLIMSDLDDTNVIHRAGYDKAQQVKRDAAHLLENFSIEGLEQMNKRFIDANISPGGAADMLSLTMFLFPLLNK